MNALASVKKTAFNRILSQSLMVAALSATALASGWVPEIYGKSPSLVFNSAAYAQEQFSDEEITNYARAVLQIEKQRVQSYEAIKQEVQKNNSQGTVPPIVCNETSNINRLERNIREIAVDYCSLATKFIEGNDLTVSRFNEITMTQQNDPAFKERIQQELIRILQEQQSGNNN
ncbi:MAG: DUF4168 domain-containing protein [Okeania sp. SIO2H7]|nr:DUF4168 domain-containing protein [Okeania sp. SIO2H7]